MYFSLNKYVHICIRVSSTCRVVACLLILGAYMPVDVGALNDNAIYETGGKKPTIGLHVRKERSVDDVRVKILVDMEQVNSLKVLNKYYLFFKLIPWIHLKL